MLAVLFFAMGFLLSTFVFPAPAFAASWWPFADDGLTGGYEPIQHAASAMVVFDGNLYVGTGGRVNATDGEVICERAMYFTPPGAGQRVLGHDSIGFVP